MSMALRGPVVVARPLVAHCRDRRSSPIEAVSGTAHDPKPHLAGFAQIIGDFINSIGH
jgi:hypothetical protein